MRIVRRRVVWVVCAKRQLQATPEAWRQNRRVSTAETGNFDLKKYAKRGDGPGRSGHRPGAALGKLFDRLPPTAPEAEMSLLGSLILDPGVASEVIGIVHSGGDFHSEAHAAIYDTLVQTYDLHQSGDLVQLVDALKSRGVLEEVGGADYLIQLAEAVPSAVNAPHYARIVAEKAKLRRLIDAAGQILYDAYHSGDLGPDGARDVLDKAERMIFDVAEQSQSVDAQLLRDLLHEAMELLEANEGRAVTGVCTGYYRLDELTSGLQPGELLIIAARPSMGKTALALNLAEQVALSGGHNGAPAACGFFSLEMSKQAVTQRIMCAKANVDSHLYRTNRLGEEHFRKLIAACGQLGEAPLYIDDTPGLTILQLRARARRMAAQHHIKCLFIDYLQLLTAPGSARESRQVEVSAISRGIKALARELNIPVVCLSQLNRGAEQREGHRPRMSDLRESGSIEQDADVIMLLHREEYYHQGEAEWLEENPEKEGLAELIIAKQRNGPTGVVELLWDAKTTRFKNHAGRGYASAHADEAFDAAPAQSYNDPPPQVPKVTFSPGAKTGPIANHRDGGGPDADWEDEDIDDLPI
ncbi:MAG: replicative DNA helicase [Phycisphaeraceae bacterium]|nr:MAG: replicative DNA helicase [Phycisphaeraceae bacterium]